MMAMARALLRAPLLLVGILVTMRVILVCVIREGQSTPRVIQLDAFGLSWQGAPSGSAAPALLQPLHGRHLLPGCFVRSVHPEQSFTAAARSSGKAVPGWSGMLGATEPEMGAISMSEAAATARCEKELGTDWRYGGIS